MIIAGSKRAAGLTLEIVPAVSKSQSSTPLTKKPRVHVACPINGDLIIQIHRIVLNGNNQAYTKVISHSSLTPQPLSGVVLIVEFKLYFRRSRKER
jgi:hypothetical protein